MQPDLLESLGGTHEISNEVNSNTEEGGSNSNVAASPITEISADSSEAQKLAKADMNFLAGLAMPDVFTCYFPLFYLNVWQWLTSNTAKVREFPKLALGLPRGFAKSTVLKLFILFCILFSTKRFILIIAATNKLAVNILSDVMDMLEEPNIKRLFGDWQLGCTKNTQELKVFGYRGRTVILAALGAEASLRGLNLTNARPDLMLFDDIQSRECADSEVQTRTLETWMIGTAMKAKAPDGCMYIFLANMYPTKHSILRKLKYNSQWLKLIVGGILANGESLWEELHPIAQLQDEYLADLESGHPEIFCSEVLNDEHASANMYLDLSNLPSIPYEEGDIPAGNFIIIDPADNKKTSDDVSIGYFEVHNARPMLMKITAGNFSPGQTIMEALKFALTYNCRLIVVEGNAYQATLCYWFGFICNQRGIAGIEAVPIYSGKTSKNNRILSMLKTYAEGDLYIHPDARPLVHSQITDFNALKQDNVDGALDLLVYAPRVLHEFGHLVTISNVIEVQEYEAIEVPEYNTNF